jgi:hypothetical protein
MKLTSAVLVLGIVMSLGGAAGLLAWTFHAHAAGAAGTTEAWIGDSGLLAPRVNRIDADGSLAGRPDQAIAVVLARMLHRSETGKIATR